MADQVKPGWYSEYPDAEWLRWWDGKAWAEAYWPTRVPSRPYLPEARRFDISAPGEPRFDIVGENWREAEILAAINRSSTPRDLEFEGYGMGDLVPEPDNPHDPNAISVRVAGYNVGYLPSEYAPLYREVIGRFVTSGVVPQVRVRIWGVTRFVRSRHQDELKSAIRLALPSPDEILPSNTPPADPYFLIPPGRTIQVTGEEKHLETLAPYVRGSGAPLLATLHSIAGRAKDSTVLEVRLGGLRVGQLTPATSGQLMPLVNECHDADRVAAVWASVSGSRLAAEVKLRAIRADEIDDEWPRESDVIPEVGELNSPAPAFAQQVTISSPPPARGVPTWLWVATAILALILLAIPYVGWIFSLAAIAGVIWWHAVRRRQAPSRQFTRPAF